MKKSIAIIGGGVSALMLAAQLDNTKFDVSIFEANTALGRKFLVAGDGGFNLSHSENTEQFIKRYTPSSLFENLINTFGANDLIEWLSSIGIETYIGSSKRIFPEKGIKPIDVLNAIVNELEKKSVTINTKHLWTGWENDALVFETNNESIKVKSDITIFSLGGASWEVTGSNQKWLKTFSEKGINTLPFQASNCAYQILWKEDFIKNNEGNALKNIAIKCEDIEKKGELIITEFGLEGGAIYALSPTIRKQLNENKKANITIDLKPVFSLEEIQERLSNRGNRSISEHLKKEFNLNKTQLELIKQTLTKEEYTNPSTLALTIKHLPLTIINSATIDEAISTVGGIPFTEVDANFQFKKLPNNYALGEMLDWDAPTGGYLLQGCFSMGFALAKHLNSTS